MNPPLNSPQVASATHSTAVMRGVGLALLGMFIFSLDNIIWKYAVQTISVGGLLLLDKLAAIAIFVPLALYQKRSIKIRSPRQVITYTLFSLAELYAFSIALGQMPMAELWVIVLTTPILTAFAAHVVLHEKLLARQWVALIIAFAGVTTMILGRQKGGSEVHDFSALGLGAAFASVTCNMTKMLFLRSGRNLESSFTIATWSCIFSAFILTAAGETKVLWQADWQVVLLVLFGGLIGTAGLLAYLHSFQLAPASTIAPTQYSQMVWSVLSGFFIFHEPLIPTTIVAALLLIVSGGVFYWRVQDTETPSVT